MTRILVVDDLESQLYLAKSLFEPYGYDVTTAPNADAAMLALEQKGPFDLILSDIGMPEGDGFQLIERVKSDQRFREIPFVFLTASYWAEGDKKKGMDMGATKFVFRPLEARAILTEIEEVLPAEKRMTRNGNQKKTG